jgi:uncharacterized protein (DUF433 family)
MTTTEVQEIKTELINVRQELRRLSEKMDSLVFHPRHVPDPSFPNIVRIDGVQGGEPMIREKYVTVGTIVALFQHGQTPGEIVSDYDGRLTLADVHSALSYYYTYLLPTCLLTRKSGVPSSATTPKYGAKT